MHTSEEENGPIGTNPNDHNSESRVFDLGNGVKVFPARAETWVVESKLLGLPWKRRQEGFPGTAVEWGEQLMEVVDAGEDGHRFLLAPWPQEEVLRTAFSLDSGWIQSLVGETTSSDRARRIRALLVGLLPFTGLLPRTIQMRLEQDFNFPASRRLGTSVHRFRRLAGDLRRRPRCADETGHRISRPRGSADPRRRTVPSRIDPGQSRTCGQRVRPSLPLSLSSMDSDETTLRGTSWSLTLELLRRSKQNRKVCAVSYRLSALSRIGEIPSHNVISSGTGTS